MHLIASYCILIIGVTVVYSGVDATAAKAHAGVATYLRENQAFLITGYDQIDERTLKLKINVKGQKFTFLNLYAPADSEIKTLDTFIVKTEEILENIIKESRTMTKLLSLAET